MSISSFHDKKDEQLTGANLRVVLCGASKYEEKYYFNRAFDKLPDSVKDELHIMCVQFTEEVGGIFTVVFTPEGDVEMETQCEEGDLLYDEIGCGLTIKSLRRSKQELFQSLSVYYKVMILHMDPSTLISDEAEVDVNDPVLMNDGYTAIGEDEAAASGVVSSVSRDGSPTRPATQGVSENRPSTHAGHSQPEDAEDARLDRLSQRLRAEADADATEVKTTFASSDLVRNSSAAAPADEIE